MRDTITHSLLIFFQDMNSLSIFCTYTVFMVLILATWITEAVVESFELGKATAKRKG